MKTLWNTNYWMQISMIIRTTKWALTLASIILILWIFFRFICTFSIQPQLQNLNICLCNKSTHILKHTFHIFNCKYLQTLVCGQIFKFVALPIAQRFTTSTVQTSALNHSIFFSLFCLWGISIYTNLIEPILVHIS